MKSNVAGKPGTGQCDGWKSNARASIINCIISLHVSEVVQTKGREDVGVAELPPGERFSAQILLDVNVSCERCTSGSNLQQLVDVRISKDPEHFNGDSLTRHTQRAESLEPAAIVANVHCRSHTPKAKDKTRPAAYTPEIRHLKETVRKFSSSEYSPHKWEHTAAMDRIRAEKKAEEKARRKQLAEEKAAKEAAERKAALKPRPLHGRRICHDRNIPARGPRDPVYLNSGLDNDRNRALEGFLHEPAGGRNQRSSTNFMTYTWHSGHSRPGYKKRYGRRSQPFAQMTVSSSGSGSGSAATPGIKPCAGSFRTSLGLGV
ncbi:hypothetical protein B0H14DRAFT_2567681 [Mycena olivaceomarginata]|nr:hypothetical protein B0H14DRAFT_2567681 [Mycena olivaceomarginata]